SALSNNRLKMNPALLMTASQIYGVKLSEYKEGVHSDFSTYFPVVA
ncbi:hypothetical protein LTSEBAI_2681, partial [Salmonella enterica subsp. enterica serovar Baildon str. R6-199]